MTELLFLVARNHAGLLSHLRHEFSGGDVHILVDRRHRERRRPGADRRAAPYPDRRRRQRRARRTTEQDLRSIGYSIVTLQEAEGRVTESLAPANPTAVREVARYLQERFRFFTPIPSWDVRREGQEFVLLDGAGRPTHRLLFTKEFLDSYDHQDANRIPRRLDGWKLTQHVERAGPKIVLVSSYGVRTGDW
jgi:hypothetical protein